MDYRWGEAADEPAREDARPTLSRFERTSHPVFAPRGKQIEDEFRRMALGKDSTGPANGLGFARSEQFGKSPALAGSKIAQRDFIAMFPGNFPPAFVKHCQFVNA